MDCLDHVNCNPLYRNVTRVTVEWLMTILHLSPMTAVSDRVKQYERETSRQSCYVSFSWQFEILLVCFENMLKIADI